jgi:hypothetical protein
VEQQGAARGAERQVAQFVQDHEVELERDDSTRNHTLRFGCSFGIPAG